MKLSEVGKIFEGVEELLFREQFINFCPRDISIVLKETELRYLEELAPMAEQYVDAHNKKLSTETTMARHDVKVSEGQRDIMWCFACDNKSHRSVDFTSRAFTSRNKVDSCFHCSYRYKCGSTEQEIKFCKISSPRTLPTQQRSGG